MPSHFYGEMAKTELGCAVLGEKGHFGDFARFIRDYGLEADDAELIVKLKSILWAVVRITDTCNYGGSHFHRAISVLPRAAYHSSRTRTSYPS
jgi:rapamycin-insensitive companion of mTOR